MYQCHCRSATTGTMVNCICHWISARSAASSCLTTRKMKRRTPVIIYAYDTIQERLYSILLYSFVMKLKMQLYSAYMVQHQKSSVTLGQYCYATVCCFIVILVVYDSSLQVDSISESFGFVGGSELGSHFALFYIY